MAITTTVLTPVEQWLWHWTLHVRDVGLRLFGSHFFLMCILLSSTCLPESPPWHGHYLSWDKNEKIAFIWGFFFFFEDNHHYFSTKKFINNNIWETIKMESQHRGISGTPRREPCVTEAWETSEDTNFIPGRESAPVRVSAVSLDGLTFLKGNPFKWQCPNSPLSFLALLSGSWWDEGKIFRECVFFSGTWSVQMKQMTQTKRLCSSGRAFDLEGAEIWCWLQADREAASNHNLGWTHRGSGRLTFHPPALTVYLGTHGFPAAWEAQFQPFRGREPFISAALSRLPTLLGTHLCKELKCLCSEDWRGSSGCREGLWSCRNDVQSGP